MSEVSSTHVYVSHSFYFLLPRQYIDYGHSSKYWIESLEIRFCKCVLNNAATNVVRSHRSNKWTIGYDSRWSSRASIPGLVSCGGVQRTIPFGEVVKDVTFTILIRLVSCRGTWECRVLEYWFCSICVEQILQFSSLLLGSSRSKASQQLALTGLRADLWKPYWHKCLKVHMTLAGF